MLNPDPSCGFSEELRVAIHAALRRRIFFALPCSFPTRLSHSVDAIEFLVNGVTRYIARENIFAIELGNEPGTCAFMSPSHFPFAGMVTFPGHPSAPLTNTIYHHSHPNTDHYAKNIRRPASYAFPDFNTEYTTAHTAITKALTSAIAFEYQGPAYAYPWTENYLTPFMDAQKATTRFIS